MLEETFLSDIVIAFKLDHFRLHQWIRIVSRENWAWDRNSHLVVYLFIIIINDDVSWQGIAFVIFPVLIYTKYVIMLTGKIVVWQHSF